ncbi:DNA-3-methyladenine glycosylase family protein [Rufibacter roseus]|uniref:DNA-3-methyladenine glycosylase II n=1 Tax=Rufibacter roseus TaxID=1567108 RepID=A0ABW2DS64_9BACT|nr:DNA-3-methyladenine glycosylase [Rufibacter roseus]
MSHASLFPLDPLLQNLIASLPPLLERVEGKLIYDALLSSVISQQLSVKAAATIKGRFLALFPESAPKPHLVLASSEEDFRNVGLSRQKASYIKSIAEHAQAGNLHQEELIFLPDEELIKRLTQIKGVGRWTAEMILMFALNRPDVMPLDDLGIYNAMKKLYHIEEPFKVAKPRMQTLSNAWRPHRTLACRYLWRSLDNEPLKSPES